MDLLYAQNVLLEHFINNPLFKLSDYNKIFLLVEDVELYQEIVKLAADNLVKENILRHFVYKNDDYYCLFKPLESFEQNVFLSALTCNAISKIINGYCAESNDKENICNTLNITDRDIRNLIKLILTENKDKNED